MGNQVLDRVMAVADQLRDQAVEAERIGRLPDETVKVLKAAGNIRLLQPSTYGGYEAHPREFAETVMATAALDPASGWINGVVGFIPTSSPTRIPDSWDVVGLRGTGSKDVIVKDAFIPHHRAMNPTEVMDGTAQRDSGLTQTLYQMPWSTMFPLGNTSAVIGIAEGALAAHLDYQRNRVTAARTAIKDDPYVLYAIGEAAADINAARQELLANVDRIYDIVDTGAEVPFADRAAGRRTQIRAAWRAVMAVDHWRDAHVGLAHAIHLPGTTFHASALSSFGVDPVGPLRAMI